jgi:hypothetical protein
MTLMPADNDALGHDHLAEMIAAHLRLMPLGSVVSLQGSWGSGKTDVLRRVFDRWNSPLGAGPDPLWLNPWKYGTPDLITPVVLQLVGRVEPEQRRGNKRLRRLAEMLVRAGSAMAFKAVTIVAPFGEVFGAGQPAVDAYVKELFESQTPSVRDDLDPVAEMATSFKELVDEYLTGFPEPVRPLVVCVDDLDRCLPDHQIAMLEAIHFLTAAGAAALFVVALDPVLVRQAAETHYRTSGFDSNRYLDKLFDLRVNLPSLRTENVKPLVLGLLGQQRGDGKPSGDMIAEVFGVDHDRIASAFGGVFRLPELTNPRLIVRTVDRLRLLANALIDASDHRLEGDEWLTPLLAWTAIAERWPQLRQVLQATSPSNWGSNAELVAYHYGIESVARRETDVAFFENGLKSGANVIARLPTKEQSPDIGSFLELTVLGQTDLETEDMMRALQQCDQVCREYGL